MHQPWTTLVLSGAVTAGQLASNLQALEVPAKVLARLPVLDEPADHYWATRSSLPWT